MVLVCLLSCFVVKRVERTFVLVVCLLLTLFLCVSVSDFAFCVFYFNDRLWCCWFSGRVVFCLFGFLLWSVGYYVDGGFRHGGFPVRWCVCTAVPLRGFVGVLGLCVCFFVFACFVFVLCVSFWSCWCICFFVWSWFVCVFVFLLGLRVFALAIVILGHGVFGFGFCCCWSWGGVLSCFAFWLLDVVLWF